MRRHPRQLPAWQEKDEGESAGPYTIRLDAPGRWKLVARGRSIGFYPTRTAARQAATSMHQRHGLRRQFVAYLVVVGISLAGLVAALIGRTEPNPEYEPARAVADRFDQARLAVETGEAGIHQIDQMFDGIRGGSFEHGGRIKLGLAGVFDGDCYGLTWRSGYGVGGVVKRSNYVTCQPDANLIEQPNPPGLVAEPLRPAWEYTLPEPVQTRVWFIPVFTISFGFLLLATFRATGLLFALRR